MFPQSGISSRKMRRTARYQTGYTKHPKLNRRKHRPVKDLTAYLGLLKIRDFCLRAGVLVIPFEEHEMRTLVTEARDAYLEDGVIPVDIQMKLNAAGADTDQMMKLWDMMATAEVDTEVLDPPINNFQ